MSRRHPGGYVLPDNPSWLEFPRSDGDPAQLPKNTTRVVDGEGQVNFMRPVGVEESLMNLWRVSIGTQLAIRMKLPGESSLPLSPQLLLNPVGKRAPIFDFL